MQKPLVVLGDVLLQVLAEAEPDELEQLIGAVLPLEPICLEELQANISLW